MAATAASTAPGSPRLGVRSTGKRSGSNTSVPKPPSPMASEPVVSPWYAPPNARYVVLDVTPWLVQYWKAILMACSTAAAPSEANRNRGRSTGTLGASASASSMTMRLPLPSSVEWATRPSWSRTAWSSSGTPWPSVVTQSDEMASK